MFRIQSRKESGRPMAKIASSRAGNPNSNPRERNIGKPEFDVDWETN